MLGYDCDVEGSRCLVTESFWKKDSVTHSLAGPVQVGR
jgi:hypothetical protein